MNKPVIFMFSGQGSQYYQMGKELYENNEHFRYWMNQCDEIASPLIQASLLDILYHDKGKNEPFDNLLYSNPALLSVEYSLFKVLQEMGIQPDYLMGYSLGELTSSVASGAVSLEDGMQLVVDIARLAEQKAEPATMMAIIGSRNMMIEYPELFRNCWLTGKNFKENFVVCGSSDEITQLQQILNARNIITQILPVRYGFHTSLIDPIESDYKRLTGKIRMSDMNIPVISSLKMNVVHELTEDHLWGVIRYSVNFEQTVESVLMKGDYIFIDAGPSGTLATFVKYMLPSNSASVSLQTINPFGRDLMAFDKLKPYALSKVS